MRRSLLASLVVLAAALAAPVPAQAQLSDDQRFECLQELLVDPSGDKAQECTQQLLEQLFPNMEDEFCDDCDPTFDPEQIRRAVIAFDRGRALRERLVECRNRRLFNSNSEDSLKECVALERFFELYVNSEGSLEARRRDQPDTSGLTPDGTSPSTSTASVRGPQSLRRGILVLCRVRAAGTCRVRVSARRRLLASGARSLAREGSLYVRARPTRQGRRILSRVGRIRVRITVYTPGAQALRKITVVR